MTDEDYMARMAKAVREATHALGDVTHKIVEGAKQYSAEHPLEELSLIRPSIPQTNTGLTEKFKDQLVDSVMHKVTDRGGGRHDDQTLSTLPAPETRFACEAVRAQAQAPEAARHDGLISTFKGQIGNSLVNDGRESRPDEQTLGTLKPVTPAVGAIRDQLGSLLTRR